MQIGLLQLISNNNYELRLEMWLPGKALASQAKCLQSLSMKIELVRVTITGSSLLHIPFPLFGAAPL